jgi:hypothetical protein
MPEIAIVIITTCFLLKVALHIFLDIKLKNKKDLKSYLLSRYGQWQLFVPYANDVPKKGLRIIKYICNSFWVIIILTFVVIILLAINKY